MRIAFAVAKILDRRGRYQEFEMRAGSKFSVPACWLSNSSKALFACRLDVMTVLDSLDDLDDGWDDCWHR